MLIKEFFKHKKPVLAFEVFPPKHDVPVESIYDHLEQFEELRPDYISVTYGAGGSRKGRTLEIASRIKNNHNIESMAHFTCVGHTTGEIDSMLSGMHERGLENILALRGDAPDGSTASFQKSSPSYCFAHELVSHIRSVNNFCIAAAAYVEGHADCRRLKDDLIALKCKVDAGVDFLITQLFFDNRLFYNFLDRIAALDINVPVSAGIMPIFKSEQIKAITAKSGCSIPAKLVLMMDKYQDNAEDIKKAGIEYASMQIRDLADNGVDGIHLYTMNRPKATAEILEASGLLKRR